MARDIGDLSQLEREFELEMDDESADDLEFEAAGSDTDQESESIDSYEAEQSDDFAERFYELSQGSYESEFELDEDVNRLVAEMEHEFFFKGLGKKLRSAGKGLLKKAARVAADKFPAFKALTQLSRGNLKGMLGSLAKAGLASAIPGGAVALPALKALGFEAEDPEANREAWQNYTDVSREAFQYLAENLNEKADDPAEATRLATAALQAGLRKAQGGRDSRGGRTSRTRVIRLRRGERLVIKVE